MEFLKLVHKIIKKKIPLGNFFSATVKLRGSYSIFFNDGFSVSLRYKSKLSYIVIYSPLLHSSAVSKKSLQFLYSQYNTLKLSKTMNIKIYKTLVYIIYLQKLTSS